MRKHRVRAAGVVLSSLMIGLAACTPQAPPAPTATPPGTQTTTTARPGAEPGAAELPGPFPMPAADGEPMLWPTTSVRTVDLEGWTTEQILRGFVDTNGALIVPPRYEWYDFCRDEAGRASLVLAGTGATAVDVLDLSGQVIGQVPGRFADCLGDTHAIVQTDLSENGPLDVGSGLFDLHSGKLLIRAEPGRTVAMIDHRTVNVHRAGDEYFLDLVTGEKTPHPGFLTGYLEPSASAADLALIPASTVLIDSYTEPEEAPLIGYLDRSGGWALEPAFQRADPFQAGYAVVGDDASVHFIDTAFQRVGGDWAQVDATQWGYRVEAEADDRTHPGLLGLDLRVILEPGVAETNCGWSSPAVCDVYPHVGPPQTLLLPEGALIDPPEGFTEALSRTQFSDKPREGPANHIHDVSTGITFALDRPSYCRAVDAWISCEPQVANAPPAVYRPTGERTEFRDVTEVEPAVRDTT
ncbi:MAG: WG repeat-containing protein, partial [Propionibacteriaceae bacterium]|nr:WG repeat-containing protein [Propionibacteriaceae bacterium]